MKSVMINSWPRDETRWSGVRLPWKIDPKTLGNNRIHALQRDENLNKKLSKNVEVEDDSKGYTKKGRCYLSLTISPL